MIINNLWQQWLKWSIFFGFILALSLYFYRPTIMLPPSHIHAWTQSDRLALALGFIDNDFNFFLPQTFNLATKEGITGVDLPIHEYFIAGIMRLSGSENPMIFRIYVLLFSFLGYAFFFRLACLLGGSWLKSGIIALFAFSCPILVYYQAGFIPSATSFSSALVGYFFYFRYLSLSAKKDFGWAVAWLTLAALVRTPFNIALFAVFVHQIWGWLLGRRIVWRELAVFAAAYLAISLQFMYKSYLNSTYGSQFLTQLLTAESWAELREISVSVWQRWSGQVFTNNHYILLGLAALGLIWQWLHWRKISNVQGQMSLHTLILSLGGLAYFLLMSRQFPDHEYYFIDCLYLPALFFFMLGISGLPTANWLQKSLLACLSAYLLFGAVQQSKAVQELKYAPTLWDRGEVTRHNFAQADQLLDSLGIAQNAKILVLDAYSTNAPLIALRRKGFTTLSTKAEKTAQALQLDFDYICTQDIFFASDLIGSSPDLLPQLQRVGGNGKISIFQYKPQQPQTQTIAQALGATSQAQTSAHDSLVNIQADTEFANLFEQPDSFNFSHIVVQIRLPKTAKIQDTKVVCSLTKGETVLYYWEFPLRNSTTGTNDFCFVLPPAHPNAVAKCYIWNPHRDTFSLLGWETTHF
jgi:hypothetical protein